MRQLTILNRGKSMSITKQKPKEKVYLAVLGKEVTLNYITLADDDWLEASFGPSTIQQAFETVDMKIILQILWRLLDSDSKRLIREKKLTSWDDFEEIEINFSSPSEKLFHIVQGAEEVAAVMTAIYKTRVNSMPEARPDLEKKTQALVTPKVSQETSASI